MTADRTREWTVVFVLMCRFAQLCCPSLCWNRKARRIQIVWTLWISFPCSLILHVVSSLLYVLLRKEDGMLSSCLPIRHFSHLSSDLSLCKVPMNHLLLGTQCRVQFRRNCRGTEISDELVNDATNSYGNLTQAITDESEFGISRLEQTKLVFSYVN